MRPYDWSKFGWRIYIADSMLYAANSSTFKCPHWNCNFIAPLIGNFLALFFDLALQNAHVLLYTHPDLICTLHNPPQEDYIYLPDHAGILHVSRFYVMIAKICQDYSYIDIHARILQKSCTIWSTQDMSRSFFPITSQILQDFMPWSTQDLSSYSYRLLVRLCKNHDKILIRKNLQDRSYIILLKLARSLEVL